MTASKTTKYTYITISDHERVMLNFADEIIKTLPKTYMSMEAHAVIENLLRRSKHTKLQALNNSKV